MSLLLLGVSSQGVGLNIAEKAIGQGIKVTAVVRRQGVADYLREQGATVLHADAVEVGVLDQACQLAGSNATVVSTLCGVNDQGEILDFELNKRLIDAAEKHGLKRMVLVTSLGCGDSWQYLSLNARQAFGTFVRYKSLAESWLQTSTLHYVILRPGGLNNDEESGNILLSQREVHGSISRSDVAQQALNFALKPELDNAAFGLVNAS
ncbi:MULTISPECIES: NAD(P)H-binding protein [Vibrio]|uniref:NAD(P)-binding domain-containing protein n=1 Tax=Vibrio vulnificus TaxID=672 RepID=A0A2S3R332_VIBVL|nr:MULTISPECIES: NAD(P)H-binding protein [Vibrio]MBG0757306.1 hypothetical protein [Vibrio cidicii]POB48110.1 hypothetical protein CRN52_10265 [Vibrio vulnificus]